MSGDFEPDDLAQRLPAGTCDMAERETAAEERRRLADALRDSEQRFRATFEQAAVGVAHVGIDGHFLLVNDRLSAITGYLHEELMQLRFQDITHPDDLDTDVEQAQRLLAGEITTYTMDKRYVRKDGSPVWVSLTGSLVHDTAGAPDFFVAVIQDVDERKRAEEALRTSESFHRQTVESIPGMVFTTRPDGYCDYQSQQWVDYTGVPLAAHLGDGWSNLLHDDDKPRAFSAWRSAVAEKAPYDLEYRVRRHDGAYEWFRVIGTPIRDAEGQIVRWFGVAVNIEALKHAEAALRVSAAEQTRQAQRLAVLKEVAEAAGASLSVSDLAQHIVRIVPNVLEATHIVVMVTDHEGRLRPAGARGYSETFIAEVLTPAADDSQLANAYRTRQAQYVETADDGRMSDASKAGAASIGIASFAALPLIIEGGAIGTLAIGWPEARRFTPDEKSLLESVAAEAAVGLERARLYEERTQQAWYADAVNRLNAIIHSSLDTGEVMEQLVIEAQLSLDVDVVAILMREGEEWRYSYEHGNPLLRSVRVTTSDVRTLQVLVEERRAFIIDDVTAVPDANVDLASRLRVYSSASFPLLVRGEVIGALLLANLDEPRAFLPAQVDAGHKLASTLALALQNSALFVAESQAQKKAKAELAASTTLLRAASALASSIGTPAILETLAGLITDAVTMSRLCILSYSHEDDLLTILLARGDSTLPAGTSVHPHQLSPVIRHAIDERRSTHVDYDLPDLPPEVVSRAQGMGVRLALWVPIMWKDEFHGFVALDEPYERRDVSAREVELVEAICAQAATAMVNSRLHDEQRYIATTLQQSLMHPLPEIAGLELAAASRAAFEPALIGGDFHDVFALPDGRVLITIGDVMGKGVAAAGLTETVRSALRTASLIDPDPAFLLKMGNRLLRDDSEQLATALVLVMDPLTRQMLMASAGHPPPIRIFQDGPSRLVPLRFGAPLGAFDYPYVAQGIVMPDLGDTLILYTDGVTESRRSGELFGEQRLLETAERLRGEPLPSLIGGILDEVERFADQLHDDQQLLAVRFVNRM
jgi:PAS domain S-box-containing protein